MGCLCGCLSYFYFVHTLQRPYVNLTPTLHVQKVSDPEIVPCLLDDCSTLLVLHFVALLRHFRSTLPVLSEMIFLRSAAPLLGFCEA